MGYFEDIYKKRVNRYGLDYQSRIQREREELFDLYLLKTIYRVDFFFEDEEVAGSLEKYKQDETQTLQYLLTKTNINMPNGTILMIPDKDKIKKPWLVYYLEDIKASGYNRYIVLKMTHYLTWTARDGSQQESWAYMYGQEDNMLKDEIRSRSRMDTIYAENLKMSFFVMPTTPKIKKDDYLEIGTGELKEQYRVTGYDIQSTPGVEYVTVDPTYEYDLTPAPQQQPGDSEDEFFWLNGGE
mgnify:FL=1|jgi:hypothetical protein